MIRAFGVALGMFSTLPGVAVADVPRPLAGRVLAALPFVGALLGALAGALAWVVGAAAGTLPGAVAGVALLAWLTGGLHLDGLADTADGLGSRRGPEEARAIMRRSDIGPMGVLALVFVLLADVAALGALGGGPTAAAALCVAAMTGRLVVVHAARGAGARSDGFGALFAGTVGRGVVALDTALVALAAAALGGLAGGWPLALVLLGAALLGVVIGAAWRVRLVARLGGMTGDTFGSLIEVVQLVVLAGAALMRGASAWW